MIELLGLGTALIVTISGLFALRLVNSVGIHVLIVGSFCAGWLKFVYPVRFVFFAVLMAMLMEYFAHHGASDREGRSRQLGAGAIAFVTGVLTLAIFLVVSPFDSMVADPAFRYFVLFPFAFWVGWALRKGDYQRSFARTYVAWSAVFAVLAVAERLNGTTLFPRPDLTRELVRNGHQRAILLSEHPLVLSVLLIAAIPLAWHYLSRTGTRVAAIGVITAGVLATSSRGALALLVVWVGLLLLLSAGRGRGTQALRVVAAAGTVFGSLYLVLLSDERAPGVLSSSDADIASVEYRLALYQAALESIALRPFGWGLAGLPEGVFAVESHFGTKDLALTVDSEVALAVFDFGIIGLILYLAAVIRLFQGVRLMEPESQAALLVLLSGLYLALHAWTGLPLVLLLLLGMSLARTRKGRRAQVHGSPGMSITRRRMGRVDESRLPLKSGHRR